MRQPAALGVRVADGEGASVLGLPLGPELAHPAVNPPATTQTTITRTSLPDIEMPTRPPTLRPSL
jgi:hypothetical protein